MAGAASEGRLEKVGIESKVFEDAGAKIHEGIPELSRGTPWNSCIPGAKNFTKHWRDGGTRAFRWVFQDLSWFRCRILSSRGLFPCGSAGTPWYPIPPDPENCIPMAKSKMPKIPASRISPSLLNHISIMFHIFHSKNTTSL